MSHELVKPVSIAILAMGGEGGGVLADWIVDLAEHAGYVAQTTSVPGVAQRTGATIYYVEFHSVKLAPHAPEPILALAPVAGDVDIVLCSELMEAGRAVQRGLVSADHTTLIASTHRVYSMTEKTAMGDARVDSQKFLETCRNAAKRFVATDFAAMAEQTGSVISAVLFGALAGVRALPFERADFEAAIERGGVGVETSLKAFDAGFTIATAADSIETRPAANDPPIKPLPADARLAALDARIRNDFPAAVQPTLHVGVRRLADYQDVAYGADYLDRLVPILRIGDGKGRERWELLCETARYLALWMSYEDTVRVADLKIRSGRFARVADEVKVESGQLLHINEYLHPRVDEIADTLPAQLGRWLMKPGWARMFIERMTREGRIVRTSSLRGFLQLYMVASLRGMRRRSLRFEREMTACRRWLASIVEIARDDYALAVEVAQCQRLVKGYGDTHALGMRSFTAIEAALPALRREGGAADRVRLLREAALADDSGKRLADLLGEWRLAA
ncbi:indolepyruvate oxidoreductase subunit beta family protein [Paraburkholderia sp. BL10I2N1]|uniref:indolepyruvate oxidoreductase subunit beta family protein n=1 Tax=Paraburkholderia sp. BL10I2N1 TaxID=1938796 RepID=UPI00105BDD4B|nr:indolepyruvate oxidoreductase subunit beta family protein [Paraburkholderia sp. BL10I2N1]TDN61637.1 indolepyruvate ferredoxin oxidoreductase beta subunit [Paraburkholderia sp. BL10I2N1]